MKLQEVLDQHNLTIKSESMGFNEGRYYTVLKEEEILQKFQMKELDGCCGIVTSFHAYMNREYRNQGWGTICDLIRQLIAKEDGYSILICTLVQDNVANIKIKKKNGWIKLLQFTNERTGNEVIMGVFDLTGSLIKTTDWGTEDESIRFMSMGSSILKKFQNAHHIDINERVDNCIKNRVDRLSSFKKFILKLFKIKIE